MKHLKRYKLFTEEVDFNVNITDEPDLKMAKEKLATLKSNLSDYKTKKPLIDTAYLTIKIDAELQKKIEQFQNVQGSGLTSDSLPDVLEAATEGRVDTLFLGNVHATLDHVSESMMNTAIRRALNSGAEIFESEDLLADPSQVRALLRF
jgi:hypothetical protein